MSIGILSHRSNVPVMGQTRISVIDNATSGEAMALLALGPVSVRWRGDGSAEYVHLDHLGSSVAATNAAGAVTWRESYLPFGEGRLAPAANDNRPGFTGHVDDAATGLTYMQARYFDPVLGAGNESQVMRHDAHDEGYLPHYQTEGLSGHSFYTGLSALTATSLLGEGPISEVLDFFNPVTDVLETAELAEDIAGAAEEAGEQITNEVGTRQDQHRLRQEEGADPLYSIFGDTIIGSRAVGSRICPDSRPGQTC